MNDYLWDSYALIEGLKGSAAYSELESAPIITTPFTVMETCHFLQKDLDYSPQESADIALDLMEHAPPLDGRLLSAAATWRLEHATRQRNYSYADALGYVMARCLGLTFLTGDRAFESLPGVEIRR